MIARGRRVLLVVVTIGAVVVAGVLGWTLSRAGGPTAAPDPSSPATESGVASGTGQARSAQVLGAEFLADWVDDGRVVRRDQGGDTVSEGQAYGMLIALGTNDEQSFTEIWDWTRQNLQRADGLLAWRWDGEIVDPEPAADADLDVARALVLAGERFGDSDLTDEGNAIAIQILDDLTVLTAAGRIVLPGEWAAATPPYAYNPSYASPAAFAVLGASTGDPRFAELATGSAAVTSALLARSALPPDWAQVQLDGRVESMPGPQGTGTDVRYSYDAARLAIRYAESCAPTDVALSAALARTLGRDDPLRAELDLGGGALGEAVHPLAYGARAASLAAAGDDAGARDDLAQAVAVSDEVPTYYGAAWVALAPLLLESTELGGCPLLTEV